MFDLIVKLRIVRQIFVQKIKYLLIWTKADQEMQLIYVTFLANLFTIHIL